MSGISLNNFDHPTAFWMGQCLQSAQGEVPGSDQGLARCCLPVVPELQAA